MSSFSPWGGLGEPGEACVKCGGKESTLGAHAPTRGASPKKTQCRLVKREAAACMHGILCVGLRLQSGTQISPDCQFLLHKIHIG
jgi:hypothetical protein